MAWSDARASGPLTAVEFGKLPDEEGYTHELVRGRVVREPLPRPEHGVLDVRLAARLHAFVDGKGIGVVLANAGFVIAEDPDTVRGPDLAFVAAARVPAYSGEYWRLGPDLVAEILSPSNSASATQARVLEFLAAGTRAVWVIDPRQRAVTVYRSARDIRILTGTDELDGGDVLPGFRLPLPELFG
jgi:Uma2 family endonuclease